MRRSYIEERCKGTERLHRDQAQVNWPSRIAAVDGSQMRRLWTAPDPSPPTWMLRVSPDGKRMRFDGCQQSACALWEANTDGSGATDCYQTGRTNSPACRVPMDAITYLACCPTQAWDAGSSRDTGSWREIEVVSTLLRIQPPEMPCQSRLKGTSLPKGVTKPRGLFAGGFQMGRGPVARFLLGREVRADALGECRYAHENQQKDHGNCR